ncbi:MAG: type II toxin-antitoxin system CcdA family antitoxin [Angustibacter sp.]
MPKVSVYLPDDLYAAVRDRGIPLSALTQKAVQATLRAADNEAWIARMRARTRPRVAAFDTTELMDEVRDEFDS